MLVTSTQIDALVSQGKLVPATVRSIAKVGVGIATRIGGIKPDASSIDTFKRALLATRSIGHLDPKTGSSSGTHAARWLAGIDVAAELKAKTRWFGGTRSLFSAVSTGDVELGFGQITEILVESSVELAGRFPEGIQNYTQFSAAATTHSDVQAAAQDLIDFLLGPRAARVMHEKGFEAR